MREGHYLRHLRRLKRAYAAKRDDLLAELRRHSDASNVMATGLAVLLRLPDGASDLTIARAVLAFGMFPAPLSAWYASAETSRRSEERRVGTECASTCRSRWSRGP